MIGIFKKFITDYSPSRGYEAGGRQTFKIFWGHPRFLLSGSSVQIADLGKVARLFLNHNEKVLSTIQFDILIDFMYVSPQTLSLIFGVKGDANGKLLKIDQDPLVIADNDVKKDVAKLLVHQKEAHQFAYLFLKDYENDLHFVIWRSLLSNCVIFCHKNCYNLDPF